MGNVRMMGCWYYFSFVINGWLSLCFSGVDTHSSHVFLFFLSSVFLSLHTFLSLSFFLSYCCLIYFLIVLSLDTSGFYVHYLPISRLFIYTYLT